MIVFLPVHFFDYNTNTYEASLRRPSLYLIRSSEAVLLGGVGGLDGK